MVPDSRLPTPSQEARLVPLGCHSDVAAAAAHRLIWRTSSKPRSDASVPAQSMKTRERM